MKIKDYSIIETEWINNQIIYQEKRLEAIKKSIDEDWKGKYDYEHSLEIENSKSKLYILKEIKSKLKPLTTLVEQSFEEGKEAYIESTFSNSGWLYKDLKEEYINNTVIE